MEEALYLFVKEFMACLVERFELLELLTYPTCGGVTLRTNSPSSASTLNLTTGICHDCQDHRLMEQVVSLQGLDCNSHH